MLRSVLLAAIVVLAPTSAGAAGLHVTVFQTQHTRTVAPGSQGIVFSTITLQNPAQEAISLESIVVTHRGLGESTDVTGVYLAAVSGQRLSNVASFNGDQRAELRLRPWLTIAAGTTATITVRGNLSPQAAVSGLHRLEVRRTDIVATVPVESFTTQELAADPVTPSTDSAAISVSYPALTAVPVYGRQRTVGRLQLSNTGTRDVALEALTITNAGTARGSDLANIVLVTNRGQSLTDRVDQLSDRGERSVRLVFTPAFVLHRGDRVIFNIRADLLASRRRTVQLHIDSPSDLEVRRSTRRQ